MRFYSVAIWTLTILLTGGLSAQASDNRSSEGSTQEPVTSLSVTTPTVTSKTVEPTTIAEKSAEQQLSQTTATDSWQQSQIEPSTVNQNPPTASNRQIEASAEVTPQSHSVESQTAEALRPVESTAQSLKAEALRPVEPIAQSVTTVNQQTTGQAVAGTSCASQQSENPQSVNGSATAQLAQATTPGRCPRPQAIPRIAVPEPVEEFASSPALSIYIPVGYGADNNTVFLTGSYQNRVRVNDGEVGSGGVGVGIGDARDAVGLELSYALETTDDPVGEGGFNAKLHRVLTEDLAGAIGWNGILNTSANDFEHSKYGVLTKVFRTQDSLNDPFSRVSVTVGVGDGQFRSNGAVRAGDNNVNVFGNVALRVVRPISFIAEWTGQDLALGLSIAPFRNIPFVITPAVRDLAGNDSDPRFVVGAGTAIRF